MSIRPSPDIDLARLAELATIALAETCGHVVRVDERGRVDGQPGTPTDLFAKACAFALVQMGHGNQVMRCADHMVGHTLISGCAGLVAADIASGRAIRCGA